METFLLILLVGALAYGPAFPPDLGKRFAAPAVLPLKEAHERSSWLNIDFRQATRQAIAEIQSRIQGASPGQLSLAGAEAGQLSLAQTEAGQLSLTEDPAGQLSLGDDE